MDVSPHWHLKHFTGNLKRAHIVQPRFGTKLYRTCPTRGAYIFPLSAIFSTSHPVLSFCTKCPTKTFSRLKWSCCEEKRPSSATAEIEQRWFVYAEHMTIPATAQPRTGTCDDNIKTNLTDLRCKNAVVKLPSSIQGGEFIDQISDYQVLNKHSVLYLKLQLFRGNQNKLLNTLPSRNSRKQFVTIK